MSEDIQIKQLNDARQLVLGDATYYAQIVQSILPIIGRDARVELRRWGADFLAETFSSPVYPASQKETLSLTVLETLKALIENVNEDAAVIKSVVQTAASIYPLVFLWIVNNPYDIPTWERMSAIKSRILKIWDTASTSIRVCCIKFAQRVVLAQTAGPAPDRQYGDLSDISIALVPQHHTLIPPRNLEAEASGLLDRILGVFHENASDAVLIDATINSLSVLIRARPSISQKIINAILNFNPLKLANSPMTPKLRVAVKSMEKTTRMLLVHISKRDPQNPMLAKIHPHIERLYRSRMEIFDESNRKRHAPEQVDTSDSAKRQKLAGAVPVTSVVIPPFAPGPLTVADLYTATHDEALKSFDVAPLSPDLVTKIVIAMMTRLDDNLFTLTVEGIRQRLLAISVVSSPATINPNTAPLGLDDDDDDDYEPDFQPAEDTEQIMNKLDNAPAEDIPPTAKEVAISSFALVAAPAIDSEQSLEIGRNTIARVFGTMQSMDDASVKKIKTAGLNRLAASSNDKDAWITLLSRLATRSIAGLQSNGLIKSEDSPKITLSDSIREALYLHVLEDFRKRMDIVVNWLCEEWYSDMLAKKAGGTPTLHYDKWVLRVLDGIVPYIDGKDKFLTRFLSEIPGVNKEILDRVQNLCRDPGMVSLAVNSLFYLVIMRPPAKELALDAMENIWRTYDDAKPATAKYLGKYRPSFLQAQIEEKPAEEAKQLEEVTVPQQVVV